MNEAEFRFAIDDLGVCCAKCDFNVANVPVKNMDRTGLCRNPKNYQSALNGKQYMQIRDNFVCPEYLEYQGD